MHNQPVTIECTRPYLALDDTDDPYFPVDNPDTLQYLGPNLDLQQVTGAQAFRDLVFDYQACGIAGDASTGWCAFELATIFPFAKLAKGLKAGRGLTFTGRLSALRNTLTNLGTTQLDHVYDIATAPSTTYRVSVEGVDAAGVGGLPVTADTVSTVAGRYGVSFPDETTLTIRGGAPSHYTGATFDAADVDVYVGAFTSEENLARTLFHERMHVWQHSTYGTPYVHSNVAAFENATYAAELNWWHTMTEGLG